MLALLRPRKGLQVAVRDEPEVVLPLEPRPQLRVDKRVNFLGAVH